MSIHEVVAAAIYPSIGIARLGNSPGEYFIGPELPDAPACPAGGYKDSSGRLKRQAARFRIYGVNAQNQIVAELTPDLEDVSVEWTAQVANKKSSWYNFEVALDIHVPASCARRNAGFQGKDRDRLNITPSPRSIAGVNQSGPNFRFDDGKFVGRPVYLGELRTDEKGRVLFLGGHGVSESYDGRPVYTFANNDGWHDDISDGPVQAKVTIGGRDIPVDPAWVVTAPPNYAPELKGTITMFEVMTQAAIRGGWVQAPAAVSFRRDILPLFQRLCAIEWVNYGIFVNFGWEGRQNLLDPGYLRKLANKSDENKELRTQVFNNIRNPQFDDRQVLSWPWFYGDAMNIPPDNNRNWAAYPPYVYDMLAQWAAGDFEEDLDAVADPPVSIDDVELGDQPATLTRAALEYCLAEAFHPGCEMTWPVRHSSMFMSAYRFNLRGANEPDPDYGSQLTPDQVVNSASLLYGSGAPGGPLYSQGPGDISRWMAIPWQTDTASCRSGYETKYDPYQPTFWPARVPNQVLTQENYDKLMNASLGEAERLHAFASRTEWLRLLKGDYQHQISQMIHDFGKLGVVESRPGPSDGLPVPPEILVESVPGAASPAALARAAVPPHALKLHETDKAHRR